MIESIMYFAGGFLVACLLALALISSVHHRAVRLTQRRLADSIPVSLNEIQADRDKLRARFAMSTRRLEVTVEKLETKVTSQLGEIARKSEAIARLKAELGRQTADQADHAVFGGTVGRQLGDADGAAGGGDGQEATLAG